LRLGKDRAALEAELGKPLEELDRLAASNLLGKLQLELRTAPTPERHRAYLPEAVDQYEHRYLNDVKDSGATLTFTLFNGERLEGQVAGYGPYNITVRQGDGSEVTLNKLAIVSYRRAAAGDEGAAQ
jgi:sRNA-binding regulator protein Hfq